MKLLLLNVIVLVLSVNGAVLEKDEVTEQGLYSKTDHVEILTANNFDRKVYRRNHAMIVQFYNSYCGHCRAFAPRFKTLASELVPWQRVLRLGVLDCSQDENNGVCRDFEVLHYPTLRYLYVNYAKGNGKIGEDIQLRDLSEEKVKGDFVSKLLVEQNLGRLTIAPSLAISSDTSFKTALRDIPSKILYLFLIFENETSPIGSAVILDLMEYDNVQVKRIHKDSELAHIANVEQFPALVAINTKTQETTTLTPKIPSESNIVQAVNTYLKAHNYVFPSRHYDQYDVIVDQAKGPLITEDVVFYSDLEKTLKMALHTEVTRRKVITGEPLKALLDFLDIVIDVFPFRGNTKVFFLDLRGHLGSKNEWNGNDVYNLLTQLENNHSPVYNTNLEYVACKGSSPNYRGYTCGLWTLFHTLTVNAVHKPGMQGPRILKAMYGYIKYFFGCTECSKHFQEMAAKNKLFDVNENDKAVLWLWVSHNSVNLRLAGDVTEDPQYPKIQYPSADRCPQCRLKNGAWNLSAVFSYLQTVYSTENIRGDSAASATNAGQSPFSKFDLGMLTFLYMR